jgi:hypothetical protein
VGFGFDLPKDSLNLAVRANQERCSFNAPIFFAVHRFLHPHAVQFGNRVFFIREQDEGQLFLLLKLRLSLDRVRTDTDDNRAGRFIF